MNPRKRTQIEGPRALGCRFDSYTVHHISLWERDLQRKQGGTVVKKGSKSRGGVGVWASEVARLAAERVMQRAVFFGVPDGSFVAEIPGEVSFFWWGSGASPVQALNELSRRVRRSIAKGMGEFGRREAL